MDCFHDKKLINQYKSIITGLIIQYNRVSPTIRARARQSPTNGGKVTLNGKILSIGHHPL